MKKLFLFIFLAVTAISTQAQYKASSWDYVAINGKDTVVTGDTIYIKPGANIIAPFADSLAALKIYLPTASTVHDGMIYHVTITKKITTLTYLNGTTVGLPTAIQMVEPVTKSGLDGKNIVVGGAFSIIYRAKKTKWYRYQ